ncbi:MAG TPA: MlaD family protein [Vicinamibacteria bacterium]|nr:MlaD family protein [Vicinamibacteria bacterium]
MRWSIVLLGLSLACSGEKATFRDGVPLNVLFDERHGLAGGEPVRFHDFDVGEVISVDIREARVRAVLSIEREVLEQLTEATTFLVDEDSAGLFLQTYVLDPDAPRLEEGATVEGTDSSLELAMKRARTSVGTLLDWQDEDQAELERRLKELQETLSQLGEDASEEAKKLAEELERGIDRLSKELEKAGRSEEAEKIRKKLEELRKRFE